MRREKSLLDRLDDEAAPASYSTKFDWNALLGSVISNVQNMLNVRAGSVTALVEFGMPDFNDVVNQFPDAVAHIRSAIQVFIERYEPRLKQIQVHYVPDPDHPLVMKFSIEGTLKFEDKNSRVVFDTVLTGSGQATVRI